MFGQALQNVVQNAIDDGRNLSIDLPFQCISPRPGRPGRQVETGPKRALDPSASTTSVADDVVGHHPVEDAVAAGGVVGDAAADGGPVGAGRVRPDHRGPDAATSLLSAVKLMPGSTVTVRASTSKSSTLSMYLLKSMTMAAPTA